MCVKACTETLPDDSLPLAAMVASQILPPHMYKGTVRDAGCGLSHPVDLDTATSVGFETAMPGQLQERLKR